MGLISIFAAGTGLAAGVTDTGRLGPMWMPFTPSARNFLALKRSDEYTIPFVITMIFPSLHVTVIVVTAGSPNYASHNLGCIDTEPSVNDKTIEILIQLLGHIKDHSLDVESLNEFSENLVSRGYNEREVAEALGWLFERFNLLAMQSSDSAKPSGESVRMLHEYERMKISPAIHGYLLKLRSMEIIDAPRMEKVIDYCMLLGADEITENDIDEIVASIIFEDR